MRIDDIRYEPASKLKVGHVLSGSGKITHVYTARNALGIPEVTVRTKDGRKHKFDLYQRVVFYVNS